MAARHDISFRRYAFRAAILPSVLLVVLSGVLVWQIESLLGAAAFVERTDQTITDTSRLLRRHIDMETGLRGYLLDDDPAYLEPYERSLQSIPVLLQAVRAGVAGDVGQLKLLDDIVADATAWRAFAADQIAYRKTGERRTALADRPRGKQLMDVIRARFNAFVTETERQRGEHSTAARQSARQAVWIACVGALSVCTILAVVARRNLLELSSNYEKALLTANDLTGELERRVDRRTAELNESNGALTEANAELGAFAYSISHDLRAPLRHITGFADLMKRSAGKTLSAEDAENLDTIRDTAILAGRMVDDLLLFSRIGRAEMRQEPVDVNALVERTRHELLPEMRGRDITWAVGDLPPTSGDASLLKLAISNLLSNAIKYTSKREDAKIEIFSAPVTDGQTTYAIRDNGVGFDMTYAHKLFGVFQRLHRAEEYEGTGIGLANVRRIIVRHGGRVWAESRLGDGATFYFSLPGKD